MALATDWVDFNARRFPAWAALENVDTAEEITWSELEVLVADFGGSLRESFGIAAGDRVVYIGENDVRVFVLQFALMRLRAIFVPLNWRLSNRELVGQCQASDPALIVHDEMWSDTATVLGDAGGVRRTSWPPVRPQTTSRARPVSDEGRRLLDDPVQLLFTSGTTGIAKGVLVTAGMLSWQALNVSRVDEIDGPGVRMLCPLPLFHAGGLNTLANPILMSGGCVGVLRRFDAARCVELLDDSARGFTHFGSVPTMLAEMVGTPRFEHASFSAVRHVQVAGGDMVRRLYEAWEARGITVQAHYGGTEMGPAISAMPKEYARTKRGSCGFPVQHCRVRLVSPQGTDVPQGDIGEVWISGPAVTPGYWGDERATTAAFTGDWLRTGDAGRLDSDGFLYLADRIKDMYKSGGENVYPAEVERVLAEHPQIQEVVVFGVPDDRWTETGVALIVARDGAQFDRETIATFFEGQLARYKLPSVVRTVDSLPRNVTGKVVKSELRHAYLESDGVL